MLKINIKYLFYFFLVIILCSCSERKKANPLDPGANGTSTISLGVLAYNNRIELWWNRPGLNEFVGYNLYRQDHTDSSFKKIADSILPNRLTFIDYYISAGNKYSYYITIQGEGFESSPLSIVTTTPGPGFIWIVDKYGYQVIKTTYDAQFKLFHYYTDWIPSDIAIDGQNNKALITQPAGKEFVIINSATGGEIASFSNSDETFIEHPYRVEYEPATEYFWISDSAGFVYRISSRNHSIELIDSFIRKPSDITIEHNNEIVNIIDLHSKSIWRYSFDGTLIDRISNIGGYNIIAPIKFIVDSTQSNIFFYDFPN